MWRFIPGRFAVAGLLLWSFGALAGHYTVPLLMPEDASGEPQGVVRILNATDESGTVEIYAVDDAGTRSGPATFTLNASAAVGFGAWDLVCGNAMKGLSGGIGTVSGDARLEIDPELPIVRAAYVRATNSLTACSTLPGWRASAKHSAIRRVRSSCRSASRSSGARRRNSNARRRTASPPRAVRRDEIEVVSEYTVCSWDLCVGRM